MKGLLVKDFRLMKINIKSIVLIVIMALGYNLIAGVEVATTITSMITFIFGNIAINSIAYDEADKGFGYIMTLPFTRKTYVIEKYLFTLISTLVGASVSGIIGMLFTNNIKQTVVVIALVIGFVLLIASVLLPIYIKVGVEKGRNYIYVIYGVTFGGIILIGKYAGNFFKNNEMISKIYTKIVLMNQTSIVILGILFVLVIYMVSMMLSIKIMNKKEF